MPQEVIVALLAFLTPLGGLVIVILRYIWNHFTKGIAKLEADNERQREQLNKLLGTPAEGDKPAVEGEVPRLRREVDELSDENAELKQQAEQRATERKEEQQRQQQEVERRVTEAVNEQVRKHQREIDSLKAENNRAIAIAVEKAVKEAVAPLKEQHAAELDEANRARSKAEENAARLQRVVEQQDGEITNLKARMEAMQEQVNKLEKRDTDKLVPPANPPDALSEGNDTP